MSPPHFNRQRLLTFTALATVFSLSACSNRNVYESVRQAQIQECERSAEGQARQDCLRGYEMTFEEYEQERREALGTKQKEEPKLVLPTEKKDDS